MHDTFISQTQTGALSVITAQQMRAARALAGIDQRTLAERAGVSLPTIQRMEASDGVVRGVVDTLVKVIRALEMSGVELIADSQASVEGGRGECRSDRRSDTSHPTIPPPFAQRKAKMKADLHPGRATRQPTLRELYTPKL